ncbi:MAG: hypothetical protein QXU97_05680 [Fervidicoccaceae archaeon]
MTSASEKAEARLNPFASLALVAWLLFALATGRLAEAGLISLAAALYTRALRRLYPLYAWASVPSLIVVWAFMDLETALETAYRILVLVVGTSSALIAVDFSGLARLLNKAGIPPLVGFALPVTIRLSEFLLSSVYEAYAAMRGRGVRGKVAIVTKVPLPLVVFSFNSSLYLAEALYFKRPTRKRAWYGKISWGPADVVFVFLALLHPLLLVFLKGL